MQGKASITCTILSRFMKSGLVHAMRSNGPHYKCLDEKRIEWKGVCTKDVRRVFEESFDVVHGDEGSG